VRERMGGRGWGGRGGGGGRGALRVLCWRACGHGTAAWIRFGDHQKGGRAAYLREGTFAARPNSGVVFLECFVVRYKVALEHRLPILD